MATVEAAAGHLPGRKGWNIAWSDVALLAVLAGMGVVYTSLSPHFLRVENFSNILRQASPLFFLAMGQTLCLLAGGIDLSQGSIVSLTSVITIGVMMQFGLAAGTGAGLLVGLVVGLINGVLVGIVRLSPIIVTVGTSFVAAGLALQYTGGEPIAGIPEDILPYFAWVGQGSLGPVPVPAVFMGIGLVFLHFFLQRTRLGRHIYAVGGHPEAALTSGIRVPWVLVGVYTLSGILSGIGGYILTARAISGEPLLGGGDLLLQSLGSVVIGGTSLFGGRGGVLKTFLGMLVISLMVNGLNLLGMSTFIQQVVIGGIILASVAATAMRGVQRR
ncbi:MAG: ABC transporter permease [Candidatus Tectomicrobia bacterium]|uniref:ABC transporter permease n=1 Tax=Tectimicrobiota bacterium TaxID=2528274 RepID=A0A932HZ16_UNCTE|nr:ABC transporter permease [Candidatus Tectomicrobia bacterium]